MICNGRIDKNKKEFRITDRTIFQEWVNKESDNPNDYLYSVKITRISKAHSREQENFRWGVMYPELIPALRDAGWEHIRNKDDVHDMIKFLFLKEEIVNEVTGETINKELSSSNLTVEDEMELQETIRAWAREYLNTELSLPNEQKKIL